MAQNAWASPEAPYSFSKASQMIKQELGFGTYDNSVGHLQGRTNTQALSSKYRLQKQPTVRHVDHPGIWVFKYKNRPQNGAKKIRVTLEISV